jgi:hypothetical protein
MKDGTSPLLFVGLAVGLVLLLLGLALFEPHVMEATGMGYPLCRAVHPYPRLVRAFNCYPGD